MEKSIDATEPTARGPVGARARQNRREPCQKGDVRLRQCAATRHVRPVNELIRFVAGPENRIYPDLAGKLPGRGVWVTADRKSIEEAVKSRAFARGLKCKVMAADDLADTVERLIEQRVVGALSLANKAGSVVTGFDKVAALLDRGLGVALVHAMDGAPGGIEKLDRKMRSAQRAGRGRNGIILNNCLTNDQMSLAIGRANVVHAGLCEGGSAARFVAVAACLVNYRAGVGTWKNSTDSSGNSAVSDAGGHVRQDEADGIGADHAVLEHEPGPETDELKRER